MATSQRMTRNLYRDSVSLMQFSEKLRALDGVQQASAVMATENNISLLMEAGLLAVTIPPSPNNLLIIVEGRDEASVGAVNLYSYRFAPYPYGSLSIIQADLNDGQEYDGLVFLATKFYNEYNGTARSNLVTIGVHEIAHQWRIRDGRRASHRAIRGRHPAGCHCLHARDGPHHHGSERRFHPASPELRRLACGHRRPQGGGHGYYTCHHHRDRA